MEAVPDLSKIKWGGRQFLGPYRSSPRGVVQQSFMPARHPMLHHVSLPDILTTGGGVQIYFFSASRCSPPPLSRWGRDITVTFGSQQLITFFFPYIFTNSYFHYFLLPRNHSFLSLYSFMHISHLQCIERSGGSKQ